MTARIGHALPDDVVPVLARAIPAMGFAVAAVRGPAAVVVVAAGRDPAPVARLLGAELRPVSGGHLLAAMPLEHAQDVADVLAPDVAPSLREGVSTGQVWCLVLRAPSGSLTVPVTATNTRRASRGPAN